MKRRYFSFTCKNFILCELVMVEGTELLIIRNATIIKKHKSYLRIFSVFSTIDALSGN